MPSKMLSSSRYKAHVQRAADPIARLLLRARVRPNHLTVAGLGVSCLAAWAFADGRLRTGAALLTRKLTAEGRRRRPIRISIAVLSPSTPRPATGLPFTAKATPSG